MILKPKSTVHNPKALLYKRFIALDETLSTKNVYKTTFDTGGDAYWLFNVDTLSFTLIDVVLVGNNRNVIIVQKYVTVLKYLDKYFNFTGEAWTEYTLSDGDSITLLNAQFANIGKYQTNKYYYSGSFDFMIKGTIEGTTTQYIKGNIIPLTALNIKYFNDSVQLSPDDLVVIGKRLYSVENPEVVQKRSPKAFNIYFATLNSIL